MKRILSIMLVVSMVLVFSACGKQEEKASEFKVTVVNQDNEPMADVRLQLCKDVCMIASTDENGIALFDVVLEEGYKLSVMACPEGYEYQGEGEITLEADQEEITVIIYKTE